jgi:hypothetical protein
MCTPGDLLLLPINGLIPLAGRPQFHFSHPSCHQTIRPARISYQCESHTSPNFVPVQVSYQSKSHTSPNLIPVQISSQSKSHPSPNLIPVQISSQSKSHPSPNLKSHPSPNLKSHPSPNLIPPATSLTPLIFKKPLTHPKITKPH